MKTGTGGGEVVAVAQDVIPGLYLQTLLCCAYLELPLSILRTWGTKGPNTPHSTQDLENFFSLCKDFNLLYLRQYGLEHNRFSSLWPDLLFFGENYDS